MTSNWPAWAMRSLLGALVALCIFFTNRAIAENDATRATAASALRLAEEAIELGSELKVQVADVRGALETNRKEYRDDQIRESSELRMMEERIIRAVKSA